MASISPSISSVVAETITKLTETEGKKVLTTHLKLDTCQDESAVRNSIHTDFLYDHLMFAAEKGFKWNQVTSVVDFAEKLLQQTIGKTLVEAVQIFKHISEELYASLGERNFAVYTDFVFETFMAHFSLFQMVFTQEQTVNSPKLEKTIEVPVPPLALKESKEMNIWNYEKNLEEIEQKNIESSKQTVLENEAQAKNLEQKKKEALEKLEQKEAAFNKQSLEEILKDTLQQYTTVTTDTINNSISSVMSDLESKLEKTSQPRPPQLGPPPRYELKPKLQTPSPTKLNRAEQNEEKRPKSRESTRSGKRR